MLAAVLSAPLARAGGLQPEISRPPGSTAPQPIGQVHTLRNIPEACVRLEGLFTGDAAAPYKLEVIPRDPCAQRAVYVEPGRVHPSPSVAGHWLLNDRIAVPRADGPACTVTVEIWRKPGDTVPPSLDAQGRSRLYLDKPQHPVAAPLFTAMLLKPEGCG
jgi:hypothetical protein